MAKNPKITEKNVKRTLLWGGNFDSPLADLMLKYTASDMMEIPKEEELMLKYDLAIDCAHAEMLCKQGIISKAENAAIQKGYSEIKALVQKGDFPLDFEKEDAATNIEIFLSKKYGEEVGSLHAGKSRNEHAVCCPRIYAKEELMKFKAGLEKINAVLEKKSKEYSSYKMPGFTHHQPAMLTTFGNLLDAYAQAIKRDIALANFALEYLDESPMGVAAGFGTSIPVDRGFMATALGFSKVQENGIDIVTNRGEHESVALFAVANAMNHLSSLAETLIILSMPQFGWVKIDDAYCTGSSIMPQKKNPDALEITKAKAAFAQSCLFGALSTSKSSFFGYNRDSQYQKKYLVHCFLECGLAPAIMVGIISTLKPNKEKMAAECSKYDIDSTSKVEALVKNGKMKFRQAKQTIEKQIKEKSTGHK